MRCSRRAGRWRAACLLAAAALAGTVQAQVAAAGVPAAAASAPAAASVLPSLGRPRIGLVLSGGGARGLAHVGVLKVLEEMQIPIDVITGTSMGAIVGGLYASGMRATELERELKAVAWADLFTTRVARPQLSQRRKEEDFEISPLVELGWRNGELQVPLSAVSSRGLESLLRRYTLPVRDVQRFDQLPIRFRAVATDMESGAAVVLDSGDLALALRSSMSVPGVFSPTEVNGRVLGDGGLVNNLPIDVARALGADVVIAVNIGTPPGGRETLSSAVGLTAQMLNLLTEQNVQRSLATLGPADVLIAPSLGTLTSGDFSQARDFFALGEAGARGRSDRLAPLALDAQAYARWRPTPPRPDRHGAGARIAAVRIEGSTVTNPERLLQMLDSQPGQPFDPAVAERDTARLAAGGDYARTDYTLAPGPRGENGETLVFELEDKPWGPNYLSLGLDLSTDLSGRSAFNLKISHNSHWLTRNGTEWRNRLQIGEVPRLSTELYHPLAWTSSRASDWFVAAHAGLERQRRTIFEPDTAQELATFRRTTGTIGLDIGQPWGEFGELRLGWSRVSLDNRLLLLSGDLGVVVGSRRADWTENALRAKAVVDQLDYANFPTAGYRGALELWLGRREGALRDSFYRVEAEGTAVRSVGRHTLELHLLAQTSQQSNISSGAARYVLGGFHRLSGYQNGQLLGNHALLVRLGWTLRLSQAPTLTRGFFVGATLEAGNTWMDRSDIALRGLRTGMSVYLGADTGIGPLYVGITYAPKGQAGLALSIGRP
ncbi:patatin-like phospholipase family protein [Pseudaquabacterium pictum]|uniref:patatin-like phospholipase family protein n=1 Tax=Pseudaquabacterium pictum TaxID=2315236 RepID=UPI001D13559B|nr:patatin-like phospholipase family protein [Rubrivivax pictus]